MKKENSITNILFITFLFFMIFLLIMCFINSFLYKDVHQFLFGLLAGFICLQKITKVFEDLDK